MNDLKPLHKTIIVVFFLATIAILQVLGKTTETFITVGLMVLAGLGFTIGSIQAVQKQTNGGQERMIKVIEDNTRQQIELLKLVASLPPAPTPVTEVKEDKPYLEGDYREKPVGIAR